MILCISSFCTRYVAIYNLYLTICTVFWCLFELVDEAVVVVPLVQEVIEDDNVFVGLRNFYCPDNSKFRKDDIHQMMAPPAPEMMSIFTEHAPWKA